MPSSDIRVIRNEKGSAIAASQSYEQNDIIHKDHQLLLFDVTEFHLQNSKREQRFQHFDDAMLFACYILSFEGDDDNSLNMKYSWLLSLMPRTLDHPLVPKYMKKLPMIRSTIGTDKGFSPMLKRWKNREISDLEIAHLCAKLDLNLYSTSTVTTEGETWSFLSVSKTLSFVNHSCVPNVWKYV
jgi:hypothetical protein